MGALVSYPSGYGRVLLEACERGFIFYDIPRVLLVVYFVSAYWTTQFRLVDFGKIEGSIAGEARKKEMGVKRFHSS
jgi:hypothetical protein